MAAIYTPAAAGTITDNPLGSAATTINSAGFANLPAVVGPDYMWLVLDPTASAGLPEIVQVTAHTASATSITVVRYQQVVAGLTAASGRTHASGVAWRAVVTPSDMNDLPHRLLTAKGGLISASAANTPSVLAVGADGTSLFADSTQTTGQKWATNDNGARGANVRLTATGLSASAVATTAISWATEVADASNFITAPSSTLTVPAGLGGLYVLTVGLTTTSQPATGPTLVVVAGGVTYVSPSLGYVVSTSGSGVSMTVLLPLAAADTIVVSISNSAGSTLASCNCFLNLARLSQ